MLCRDIIAVCSQIHTKHVNTLCGQNLQLLNVKLAVHIVTTGLQTDKGLYHIQRTFLAGEHSDKHVAVLLCITTFHQTKWLITFNLT